MYILIIQHLNVDTHLYIMILYWLQHLNVETHLYIMMLKVETNLYIMILYWLQHLNVETNLYIMMCISGFVSHPDWTSTNFIGLYWFVSVEVDGSLPPPEPPSKSTCLLVSLVRGPCTYALAAAGAVPLRCCAHVSDLEVARRDPQNPLNFNGCVYQYQYIPNHIAHMRWS
jgi:hypothetical protein